MQTPIADFVKKYAKNHGIRFHMPGHKGETFLGCESYDVTEIKGADALYEADGIIAESEKNATKLFGTGRTLFSTEGSSHCIRAMLYLVMQYRKRKYPYIMAARNVHKAFLYAAALIGFEVEWMWPEKRESLCGCSITAEQVEHMLQNAKELPAAIYLTSPDYLGEQADIRGIAKICHRYGVLLAVDNAHGAYLHFLEPAAHPIDLGADICCDSAHKTLPVLTGGAYLQIAASAPAYLREHAKQAMALFGSTSPSYLILSSLDLCNHYLAEGYRERLAKTVQEIQDTKRKLRENGWCVEEKEALKITIKVPKQLTAYALAEKLRKEQIECEYADAQYLVCMVTPENRASDLQRLVETMGKNFYGEPEDVDIKPLIAKQAVSIREAVFAEHELVPIEQAIGKICGAPTVSCPPAIPIVVSGERITPDAAEVFRYYGITKVEILKN